MSRRYRFLIPCLPLAAWSMGASAQFRCDCTRIVDSCKADVAVSGSSVQITSDHRECSRVDYFIDGQPFVSVAVDGEARQSRPASVAAPRVLVQSCQVCADASLGGAAALRAPGAAPPAAPSSRPPAGEGAGSDNGDGRLEAYIQVQPAYPAAASARRPTGYVEVEYTVNAEGRVEGARVTKSEPGTVFDAAALAAVSRWRYPADPGREPVKLTHRFDFRPPADAAAPAGGPSASAAGAQRPAAPRNDCLREGPVLDYGEV
ncbi:MAG TPA: energy transducer TonB, partial [Gammaproteobacteria bacterium]|nr:energy transducer TonB [Gammaproteobacteria bacterium]